MAFGGKLQGQLIKPAPLLAACQQAADNAACRGALKYLRNPFYIGDQVSGTQVSGWYGAWMPQASAYAVACRTPADVVAAVNFARGHRLRLVVKGGGHSYLGTSNAADSLLIWTRAMRGITLHDQFVPQNCADTAPVPAVTVEAGAMWMDVYDAVTTRAGRYVQGGGCTTVGVAGLVQSGGFGSFSRRYGTAAGNLLQAEVVTADGQLRTVNACTEPELFWGLKGGGGGSLAVVTKLTLRTHELPQNFGAAMGSIKAASDAAFRKLLRRYVEFHAGSLFNPHWGESVQVHGSNVLKIALVSQGLGTDEARQVWQPFLDWVSAQPDCSFDAPPLIVAVPAQGWWDMVAHKREGAKYVVFDDRPQAQPGHAWWAGDQEQVGAYLHGYESLWLPATLLQPAQRERLADALFEASRHMTVGLHFNKGLAGASDEAIARARDTATNPAVLESFALAIIATGGAPRYAGLPGAATDLAEPRQDAAAVDRATAVLRQLAPAGGSYVSESNYFNPAWQNAYWGEHYPRLRSAKAQYDPDGLFFVHNGVGSERWSADGFERLA